MQSSAISGSRPQLVFPTLWSLKHVPQLCQVDPMVLVTKNRLDGLPIYTYDQIGQGRISNPKTLNLGNSGWPHERKIILQEPTEDDNIELYDSATHILEDAARNKIEVLRSYNGREYTSHAFDEVCIQEGIRK